jgi:hypothetical protein
VSLPVNRIGQWALFDPGTEIQTFKENLMTPAIHSATAKSGTGKLATLIMTLWTLVILGACGGGASTSATSPVVALECDPNNVATFAECGTVMVSLTDADGDFLNYTVD